MDKDTDSWRRQTVFVGFDWASDHHDVVVVNHHAVGAASPFVYQVYDVALRYARVGRPRCEKSGCVARGAVLLVVVGFQWM